MGRIIAGCSPRILSRLYPWLSESNNTENIGFDKKNRKTKPEQTKKNKLENQNQGKNNKKTNKNKNCGFFSCFFSCFVLFLLVILPVDLFFW